MVMYGIFLVMFLETIYPMWVRRRRAWVILFYTISLLITATINAVLLIVYNYNGWVKYREVPGVIAYFAEESNSIMAVRNLIGDPASLLLVIAGSISDLLIIWRVYHIYGRNRKIVFLPIFLLMVGLVAEVVQCVMWFKHFSYTGRYQNLYIIFELIGYMSSILLNVGCTTLIVWRIWCIGRHATNSRTRNKYKAITIALLESGAMYTVTLLVWTVFSINPQYNGICSFITYIFTMIAPIAPMLIILQLNNQLVSAGSPSPALGEGISATSGTLTGASSDRRNQDIVSTAIRFAPLGGRSITTGDLGSIDLSGISTLPRVDEGLNEKDDDPETFDKDLSQTSSDMRKSLKAMPSRNVSVLLNRTSSGSMGESRIGGVDGEKG
ncbi:hypothetical protein FRB96_008501 [Tulasnella sp. 330]|nr:hypothetical protein FRB96_008501 [Tulasnella sp. 330]KAG8878590.1 hypothetical protein FRB97_002372 [Tulasnella sp. 331]